MEREKSATYYYIYLSNSYLEDQILLIIVCAYLHIFLWSIPITPIPVHSSLLPRHCQINPDIFQQSRYLTTKPFSDFDSTAQQVCCDHLWLRENHRPLKSLWIKNNPPPPKKGNVLFHTTNRGPPRNARGWMQGDKS